MPYELVVALTVCFIILFLYYLSNYINAEKSHIDMCRNPNCLTCQKPDLLTKIFIGDENVISNIKNDADNSDNIKIKNIQPTYEELGGRFNGDKSDPYGAQVNRPGSVYVRNDLDANGEPINGPGKYSAANNPFTTFIIATLYNNQYSRQHQLNGLYEQLMKTASPNIKFNLVNVDAPDYNGPTFDAYPVVTKLGPSSDNYASSTAAIYSGATNYGALSDWLLKT